MTSRVNLTGLDRYFTGQRFSALSRFKGVYQNAEEESLALLIEETNEHRIYLDPFTGEKDTKDSIIEETGIDITDITDYGNY